MTTPSRTGRPSVAASGEAAQEEREESPSTAKRTSGTKGNGSRPTKAKSVRAKSAKKAPPAAPVAAAEADLDIEPPEAGALGPDVSGDESGPEASADPAEPAPADEPELDTTEAGPEELDEESPPTEEGRAWRRSLAVPRWAALGAAALVVALVAALVVALMALGGSDAQGGARTSALNAARLYAVYLGGYNYQDLDHDFSVVTAHSTPSFRSSFTQSSDALKATLSQYHATSVAKVVSAGVVSATTSRAVVLVFLEQTISNTTQKSPTTDRSQVEITLLRSGGTWLIDQVQLL